MMNREETYNSIMQDLVTLEHYILVLEELCPDYDCVRSMEAFEDIHHIRKLITKLELEEEEAE